MKIRFVDILKCIGHALCLNENLFYPLNFFLVFDVDINKIRRLEVTPELFVV